MDSFLPASYRAKKEHVPGTVARRYAKDFLAEVLNVMPGAHCLHCIVRLPGSWKNCNYGLAP